MSSIDETRPVGPREAAEAAAEAVRTLNHLTIFHPSYEYPSDVDAVVAWLQSMAEWLPQALRQAARWLDEEHDAGRVSDDRAETPAAAFVTVESAKAELEEARIQAAQLAARLRAAHSHTSHLQGEAR